MAVAIWQLAFILFTGIAILHLHVSPFTKVEESFNMQAIHDILEYGVPVTDASRKFRSLFDHMTFPGAVPRTFIGSLVVSGLATPEIWLGELAGKAAQTHVRAVLAGMNVTALALFARSIEKAYGPITTLWYVVLQASQFHLWYYASRTLPNMFSFCLSTIALACLLPNPTSSLGPVKRTRFGLYFLTIATVIFRSELAILLAAHCVWLLLKPQTLDAKIALVRRTFVPSIVPGALIALLLTVSIDTYFWQSPTYLWPELSAFLSNVFPSGGSLGASAWGTQPFYWYLVVALPRLLMNQIVMIDLFFAFPQTLVDTRILDNLIPSYAYVLVYSILPHKETRFMFPIVPSLTLVAALTCTRLTINMHKNLLTKTLFYLAATSTILTAFLSHAILLPLSAQNYPGGHALEALHEYYQKNYHAITPLHNTDPSHPQIHVHLTNLALQSGVTRFLEQPQLPPQNHTADDHYPSVTLSQSPSNAYDQPHYDPIILPGDANHPALTIQPKPPSPSPSPASTSQQNADGRAFQTPTWIYDKTSDATTLASAPFWSRFDFAIVEDPAQAHAPSGRGCAWQVIDVIESLASPTLHADAGADTHGTAALLHAMYPPSIAAPLVRLHDTLRQHLRPLTRGLWPAFPLAPRLYVLRRSCADTPGPNPNSDTDTDTDTDTDSDSDVPLLAPPPPNSREQARAEADWNWDALGPLVVNKDGTLSRLANWADMNAQERRRVVQVLRKRNLIRMGEGEAEGEGDVSD